MKMKRVLIALLVLLLSSTAYSAELFTDLSKQDFALQSIVSLLICYDLIQTKEFRANGEQEGNQILGKYPSQATVDTYIFGALIGSALITYALPESWRPYWQVAIINSEILAVNHNYSVGVRIAGKY